MIQVNATSPVNWQHPLNRSLAAWFLAVVQGRTGGAKWIDLVCRHIGTLTGMDPPTDWIATNRAGGTGALEFDGASEIVSIPRFVGGPVAITVACWVKFTDAAAAHTWAGHYTTTGNQRGFVLGNAATGYLNAVISPDGTYTNAKDYRSSVAINDGLWHHGAFTFRANSLKLFIDGGEVTPVATQEKVVNTVHNSTANVTIGGQTALGNTCYNGQLDDVRFWLRALSPREVKAYYDLSRQGYPGLLNRSEPIVAFVPTAPAAGMLHTNLSGNLQSLFGGMQN